MRHEVYKKNFFTLIFLNPSSFRIKKKIHVHLPLCATNYIQR